MKTFNEYVAETTAPIIMDVVRMQKYEKRIRSACRIWQSGFL